MHSTISEEGVPLAKPVVIPLLTSCESVSSQPRVRPFLRTSLFLYTISDSKSDIEWLTIEMKLTERRERTQMGILFLLIPSAPEKWSNSTCTLNCSVRQVHSNNHRLIGFGLEADDMWSEGFGMLGILLQTGANVSILFHKEFLSAAHINRMQANCFAPNGRFGGANAPYNQLISLPHLSEVHRAEAYPSIEEVFEFIWCQRMLFDSVQSRILMPVSYLRPLFCVSQVRAHRI